MELFVFERETLWGDSGQLTRYCQQLLVLIKCSLLVGEWGGGVSCNVNWWMCGRIT